MAKLAKELKVVLPGECLAFKLRSSVTAIAPCCLLRATRNVHL